MFDYVLGFDPQLQKRTKKRKSKPEPKVRKVTLQQTEHFHRHKHQIPRIIKGTIGKREIIYGEHALKARFPNYLERHTQDYDVYSHNPKGDAHQAERALDRGFRGNFFYVKPAQHPGTYKVVAFANEEGYADFTRMPRNTPHDTIGGYKYLKLSVEKEHRMRSLRNPDYSFRWGRDRDALNRIRIYEKHTGGR